MTPPTVEGIILCDQIIQDRQSGKYTLVGVFDRIHAPQAPSIHPQISVFFNVVGEPHGVVPAYLRFSGPGGDFFDSPKNEILLGETGRAGQVVNIRGVVLPEYGGYKFAVFLHDKEAAEVSFKVIPLLDQPQATQ